MKQILSLNNHRFLLLNASATALPIVVMLAEFIASELIYAIPVLLLALWIWSEPGKRAGLFSTAIASVLALGANQLVGLIWYEPRPFMIGLGHTLLAHGPENSFPSDHTTFILTVGFALITTRAAPTWGKLVSISGALVAWARIYLGLHFPVDMLASALIASFLAALLFCLFRPSTVGLCRSLTRFTNRLWMPCGYPRAFFPDEPIRSDAIDGVPGRILIAASGPKQPWTLALRMFALGAKDMPIAPDNRIYRK